MKSLVLYVALVGILSLCGCGYLQKENEFEGKVFTVRTELKSGEGVKVLKWENATDVEFDTSEYIYKFKVNGKMVHLDPRGTVVIEEQ